MKRTLLIIHFLTTLLYAQSVKIWWSSELFPEDPIWFTDPPSPEKIRYKLDRQQNINFQKFIDEKNETQIIVYPEQTFQKILGIGASLESTTVYAINKNRSDRQIDSLLQFLIDPDEGIGLNLFRITIGTSDFSDGRSVSNHPKGFYSYQDSVHKPFSIKNDFKVNIIKIVKRTQKVASEFNQQLTFFASCWSPPSWMKTSEALIGGSLKSGYEAKLATYFRSFVEAYNELGIAIYAITLQNEPNFTPETYPGMMLDWRQERDIAISTYEEFRKEPVLDTKLWIIDHNFEYWKKADKILTSLEEENKKNYVNAVAFHDYSSESPKVMEKLKALHPDIGLQFSEMSKFGVSGMYDIQQYFQYGSESYVYWVTMSTKDPKEHNQGPYNNLSNLSPPMLIEKSPDSAEWITTPEYYLIGQFSKFIRPGAMRIGCTPGDPKTVTAVAFQNIDHSIVVVLINQTEIAQSFILKVKKKKVSSIVPYKSMSTLIWYPDEN